MDMKRVLLYYYWIFVLFMAFSLNAVAWNARVEMRNSVSQYGITWKFDKPALTGQFITGDWWVVGPVIINVITPSPGPVSRDQTRISINHWNDTSLKTDTTMRNGSAIVLKAGHSQSYDSRGGAFDPAGCVVLPLTLEPRQSLISSISNAQLPVDNFCKKLLWEGEYTCQTVMKAAAVLTCLETQPPADAFRPPYVGTEKPLFLARNIDWKTLPSLPIVGEVPDWQEFERYFQRPWIDHLLSWSQQELVPNENQPNYGREYARLVSIASLMVCLDVPQEKKEKLTIELIQRGIDLYGLAINGGRWNEGGGHSSGRKWPVLFASIMLKNPIIADLPESAVFHEDTQTYYGKGWFGQTALWQMITHHGQRDPYEEKHPDQWEKWDKTSESYRICCNAMAWTGTALAARYMKAIKLWGHDAYFDYVDRWMREDDPYARARGKYPRPAKETTTYDPFVTTMWKTYRKTAPDQVMAGNHKKWVWQDNKGIWIPNDAPSSLNNSKMDGYRPIWFELNQKYQFGDKYSGPLGTYTAKHVPLAIYSAEANKTFFVYGGTKSAGERYLLCMIGEYDHKTGMVSKPTVVYDKKGVNDPHDNPSIMIDDQGYIRVFVSGRGRTRPGFKFKSLRPLDISEFEQISEEEMTYPQPWNTKTGYFHFFTKYTGVRQLYFESSTDGDNWTEDKLLAAIAENDGEKSGHYQTSNIYQGKKLGTFFNRHPQGNVDKRTDLYYVQTEDMGKTWTNVQGEKLEIPLTSVENPARVIDYRSQGKNVYMKDMGFDSHGNPVCLYIRSNGHEPGPVSAPYEWCITRWDGNSWQTSVITESDHNYDMGSLYMDDKSMKIAGPTEKGPQPWGVGGEIAVWESKDKGMTWKKTSEVTKNSKNSHAYVRRPVDYKAPFCFFWADGHSHQFSKSELYFGDFKGNVRKLPYDMKNDLEKPVRIK